MPPFELESGKSGPCERMQSENLSVVLYPLGTAAVAQRLDFELEDPKRPVQRAARRPRMGG
jgi:hypothetical protein